MLKLYVFLLAVAAVLVISNADDSNEITFEPEIFKGEPTKPGQFPFYVYLNVTMGRKYGSCGGTLISDRWVVSAAHCLKGVSKAEVHLGSWAVRNKHEKGRVLIHVTSKDIHVHPLWFSLLAWNDVGLIQLPEPVKFTDKIQPVKLPTSCESDENIEVIAIGNGIRNSTDLKLSPVLQWAPMVTATRSACIKEFPILFFRKSVICAIGTENQSTCQGDSGGPLIRKEDQVLVGWTSFGRIEGCDSGHLGAFTYAKKYLKFIAHVTGMKLPSC